MACLHILLLAYM